MGATQSKTVSNKKLGEKLDKIAADYIFSLNFKDLENLEKSEYCNKLVILTSKIFDEYLDTHMVTYLEKKMEGEKKVGKMNTERILYLKPDDIKKLDIKKGVGLQRKKRLCIGLAEFYIKIGHLFAAIYKTLNLVPPAVNQGPLPLKLARKNKRRGFCSTRGYALKPRHLSDGLYDVNICSINKGTELKNVFQLVGMPELRELYVDVYNYGQEDKHVGKFIDMSRESKNQYRRDVETFYRAFTGKQKVPSHIDDFSQIPLEDYADASSCAPHTVGGGGLRRSKFNYDAKSSLFGEYGRHLAQMMNNAHTNQNKLLAVLKVIFKKEEDPITRTKKFTVQPNLTNKILQEQIVIARKIIVELYAKCEIDFRKGVQLFDAITTSKDFERNMKRKINLKKQHKFVAGQAQLSPAIPVLVPQRPQLAAPQLAAPQLAAPQRPQLAAPQLAAQQQQTRHQQILRAIASPSAMNFYSSATFIGAVPGYGFRRGSQGQGYYRHTVAGTAATPGVAFIPPRVPNQFGGAIPGYSFGTGPQGTGYYPLP